MPTLVDETGNSTINLEFPPENETKTELTEAEKIQEKIVINARERLLPIFNEMNLTIKQSKDLPDNMAAVVSAGMYELMNRFTVKEIDLMSKLSPEYPGYTEFKTIIEAVEDLTISEAITSLQWFSEKVKKTSEDQYNDKPYKDLGIDF